jgi:hypothetical protein
MTEPLKLECQHFIECVRDRKVPLSDTQDELRVIRILQAAQESMERDGEPIRIRRNNNNDKLRPATITEHSYTPIVPDRRWHALRA